MKPLKFLLLLIILQSFVCCEKEATLEKRYYPFVVMKSVKISEAELTFTAELIDPGISPISSYGFTWSASDDVGSYGSFVEEKQGSIPTGIFISTVTADLIDDNETYFVRPFVKTSACTVIGTALTFRKTSNNSSR